jgi:peptidoglycan/LPS O-acetylase OafA/YrhL
MKNKWLHQIDILRIISCSIVIFSHYNLSFFKFFYLDGVHGVLIFFMISGYCISKTYKGRNPTEFIILRFKRLLPALFICMLITLLFENFFAFDGYDRLTSNKISFLNFACIFNGFILCDPILHFLKYSPIPDINLIDGAYWSLVVEFRFYIIFFLIMIFTKNLNYIITTFIFLVFCQLLANDEMKIFSRQNDFFLYLPFFISGMIYEKFEKFGKKRLFFLFPLALIYILLDVRGTSYTLNYQDMKTYILIFIVFFIIMNIQLKFYNKYLKISALLTYPIYLLHQDIGILLNQLLLSSAANFFVLSIIKMITVFTLSILVYYMIEKPIQKRTFYFRYFKF